MCIIGKTGLLEIACIRALCVVGCWNNSLLLSMASCMEGNRGGFLKRLQAHRCLRCGGWPVRHGEARLERAVGSLGKDDPMFDKNGVVKKKDTS